jgi:hypothetical protein
MNRSNTHSPGNSGPGTPSKKTPSVLVEHLRGRWLNVAGSELRRGSLPNPTSGLSKAQLHSLREKAEPKKVPSCEVFTPSSHTRLEDTPLALRSFLASIKPEEDTSSSYEDLHRTSSLKVRKADRRRSCDLDSIAKMASTHGRLSSTPLEVDDDVQVENRLTEQERANLMSSTTFTELEIVQLWNQYKSNFPTGQINRKQLLQLFKQVILFFKCRRPFFYVEALKEGPHYRRPRPRALNCSSNLDDDRLLLRKVSILEGDLIWRFCWLGGGYLF